MGVTKPTREDGGQIDFRVKTDGFRKANAGICRVGLSMLRSLPTPWARSAVRIVTHPYPARFRLTKEN